MSESPEEQPSTGVLGRIGSWLSPWRARTPKSPSETFFPTTDQPLKSDREKGSEESVKPQREEVKEQSSDLSRDFVPCEEEDATQSAHREGSILGSPVTAYPKEEEFAGRRKRRTGQGKEWEESNLGTSESGNPEKNASHLTDHSSSSEQGVVWDSAYSLPQAQSREQAQTGKRLHVYLKETSVVQCGLDAFVGQEVVQTKFTGSIPFPRKSSSSFDSLEASCFTSEEGKQTNLSPIIGKESDNSGLKGLSLKSRKNLQFGLEETDTERMGRKNASRRKSTKSPHGDGGTSLQEKMPPSADHAPEGFPKSDNTVLSPEGKSPKTLKGESCVNSSSKHSPTSQTSPEEEKKETSCKTLDKFQESNSVIAAPLASVVDGAADMADDNSLYKLERKTETPESKRRSMKVSKSEVKMFTKYVSLNAQKGSAGDNQVGNTKEETEEIVTRPHDLKTITEERKPVAGRIADKINIFEQPAAGGFNRETFHTPRNVDVSPVRTATQRLKANFELREQRSNSAERYKHARSSPDSPTREGLKQIKGQVGNFTSKTDDVRATRPKTATTGMPIQSTATAAVASLKAQKLDSQGKLDTREELQKTTPAETTIKPDQRDITALGGKNLTPKEQPSDSISIDIAHQGDGVEANVPAKQASNTVEPIPNIGQHSKGPNRTGSRSKRRKSKEPSTSIIPSSENKPEDSASKPDETDAKPEQVEDQAKGRTSDELTVPVEKENNTFKGFDEPKKQSDASFTKENIDKPLSKQEPEPLVSKDEPDTAAGSRATKTSIDKKSDILPQKEGKAAGHSFLLTQRRENVSEDSQKTLAPSTSPVDDQLLAKQETPVKLEPELLMQSEEKSERGVRERNKNDTGQTDRNINISGGGTESVRTEQTQLVRDKRKPQTSRLEPASNSFERISLDPLTTTTNLEKSASAQTNNEAVLSESDGEPTKDLKSKETPGTESAVAAAEPQPHSVFLEKAENTPDDSCKHGANDAEFSSEKPFTKASEEVTVEAANASPVLITSKADSLSEPGREESAPISVTKSLSSEEAKPPTVKSVPSEVRISADIMTLSPTNPQSETSNNAESKSDFSSLKRAGEAEQRHSDSSASASTAEKGLLSPFGNGDFFSHPHILKKEQAIENKPSHTPKEETSLEDAKKIPDSFQRSSLKKRQFPRGLSKDDSSIGQDAPSSWLDVDFPKHKLKAFAPKLSSSGSESNLLDNSGELDDDDFVEKIKNLCAPFSLPPRKHYPLRPPQPPFAMPAIREDRFEKTFDPDEFKFGLSKKKKYSMDASLNTLAKLHSIEKKSALKPARASLVDRSILLSSWDPQSLLKNSNLDEEEEEFKEEIDDQIKVKSRLEGSCVLNILTSSSFRGKRNGVQAEGQQPGEVSPSETPQISLPPSYQPPMPSPTATTPLKDPFAKQIPDPSNREETLSSETVVSESGPPLPSFNDIKLPDYLEKYLPRESAKSGQSEQKQEQVQKKVVAKPSTPALGDETDHPVNKTGLTLPEAKPPSFPGIPPTTQPMLPERKNPQAPPQGRFNHKRAAKGFHKRPGKMVLFENAQFTGQTYEIHRDLADASSLQLSPLISVKVVRGCWLLYEKPDFQGRSIALEEGEIELTDVWAEPDMEKKPQGNPAMQIGSIRLAVCDYCIPRIDLFTEPEGHGRGTPYHDDTIEAGSFGIPLSTASIQVHSGVWLLFSDPGFQGMLAVLEPGVYPFPETWGFPAPFVGSLRPLKMGGFKVENPSEAKAVVYEKPAFEGSSLKIDNDVFMFGESEGCLSADAATVDTEQLKSVASLKIIGGLWVGYSEPGFEGQQHILEEGEYLNCSEWGGSEQLVSMRPILSDFLSPHLKMFSDIDFAERGLNIDLTVPVINLEDTGYGMKTQSVDVMSGIWVVFEEPGFCGEPYILEKGLYGSPEDWGALQPRVASAMPVVLNDFKNADKLKVKLFSEPGFQGSVLVLQDSVASLQDGFSVASCKVLAGSWLAFEGQDFAGRMYVLEVGHYSDLRAMGCVSPTSSILSLQTVGFEFSMPSITLFTRCGLRGKRVILSDATVNLQHAGSCSRVQSLLVEGGIWVLYEGINYRGPQILLKPGEVPDWRELSGWPKIGSLRPLLQKQVHFRLRSRQTGLMMAVTGDLDELKLMRIQETEETGGFEQIWFYQNGQLHCKLLEDCCLGPSSSVIIAGGRVGLNPEPENQVHSWSVTPEGLICYTPDPNLVLEVKGGHHYDKNQVILNTLDPNKLQQQWNLEII